MHWINTVIKPMHILYTICNFSIAKALYYNIFSITHKLKLKQFSFAMWKCLNSILFNDPTKNNLKMLEKT